jgi:hypothetical protein
MVEVSLSRVKRYLKLRSQIGQLAPKPIPGRTPTKGAVLATDLPAQLAAHHDFALEQHCKLWAISHGVVVATSQIQAEREGMPGHLNVVKGHIIAW